MSKYTSTLTKSFNNVRRSRTIAATGEDLTIQLWDGEAWIDTNTIIYAGESHEVVTRGLTLRFIVQAGGSFYMEEGTNA